MNFLTFQTNLKNDLFKELIKDYPDLDLDLTKDYLVVKTKEGEVNYSLNAIYDRHKLLGNSEREILVSMKETINNDLSIEKEKHEILSSDNIYNNVRVKLVNEEITPRFDKLISTKEGLDPIADGLSYICELSLDDGDMDKYGLDKEMVFKEAFENTKGEIQKTENYGSDLNRPDTYLITNPMGIPGVGALYYADLNTKELCAKVGGDFMAVPLSMHEMIAIPYDPQNLDLMKQILLQIQQDTYQKAYYISDNELSPIALSDIIEREQEKQEEVIRLEHEDEQELQEQEEDENILDMMFGN